METGKTAKEPVFSRVVSSSPVNRIELCHLPCLYVEGVFLLILRDFLNIHNVYGRLLRDIKTCPFWAKTGIKTGMKKGIKKPSKAA